MTALNALLVSHGTGLGGAERVLLEAVEGFDRAVINPTIVAPAEGPLAERARAMQVPVVISPAPWWMPFADTEHTGYQFRRWWEQAPGFVEPMADLIERRRIDVVYSASSPILHAALAANLTRRPHLQHMQDLLGWPHLNFRMPLDSARVAYALLGRLASLVVCVGETSRQDLGRMVPRRKSRVVPLGLARPDSPVEPPLLPDVGAPAINVGIVGVVDRRKGADVIAPVVRRACRDIPNLHVFWAGGGDPSLLASLTAATTIDGTPHLHFIGYTDRVPGFLRAMDFVLHPARNETFPRALLEAAAAGRAIVTTRCGGGGEIVKDGVNGLLADVDDDAGLAAAVVRLVREPETRRRMGDAGARWAAPFTLERYQRGMQQAFLDARALGPAIPSRVGARLMDELLALPSRAIPPLRRWAARGA
jgi:glycosyltransferase involved in cell wall biosynthesis